MTRRTDRLLRNLVGTSSTFALGLAFAACSTLRPGMIPRVELLYPENYSYRAMISPDGTRLAYIAPKDGRTTLWIRDLSTGSEQAVKFPFAKAMYGISSYQWAPDSRHVYYWHDNDGDEQFHLYQLDLETSVIFDVTALKNATARDLVLSAKNPGEALVKLNLQDAARFDLYRLDLVKKRLKLEAKGSTQTDIDWLIDSKLNLVGQILTETAVGSPSFVKLRQKDGSYKSVRPCAGKLHVRRYFGISNDGSKLYVASQSGYLTARLFEYDIARDQCQVIASHPDFDLAEVVMNPADGKPLAARFDGDIPVWRDLNPARSGITALTQALGGTGFHLISADKSGKNWIAFRDAPSVVPAYFLLKHEPSQPTRSGAPEIKRLFSAYPKLEGYHLATTRPMPFKARDGMKIHAYLTEPATVGPRPERGWPTVVFVHGGPYARDEWEFDPMVQWFANRGYAVIQVNYRGSTGFGSDYFLASRREWGGKMLFDLIDAKRWAVREKISDGARTCIAGASFGGYSALAGMAFTPGEFRCGISVAGLSELILFRKEAPAYWVIDNPLMEDVLGDPEKDAAFLKSRSPLYSADKIQGPLLIIQGVNDPRVRKNQSDLMVKKLQDLGKAVEYLIVPETGHSWPMQVSYRIEGFLAKHLGGLYQAPDTMELQWDGARGQGWL